MLKRLDVEQLDEVYPNYIVEDVISLTSGSGTVVEKFESIFREARLSTGIIASRINNTVFTDQASN